MQVQSAKMIRRIESNQTAERSQSQSETILLFCSNIQRVFFLLFLFWFSLSAPSPVSADGARSEPAGAAISVVSQSSARGEPVAPSNICGGGGAVFLRFWLGGTFWPLPGGASWTFCTRNEQLREARPLLMGSPAVDRLKTEVGFVSVCYDFSFNSWTLLNQTLSFCRMFTRQRESVLDSIRSRPSICLSQIALGSPACLIFERFLSFWQIREVL